jgi:nitrite reductase/ring-hydroxylating ferredoxin subunit
VKPDPQLVALCPVADVAPGGSLRVLVGSHALAVFNVDGCLHVTDDTCTHGLSSLAEGDLDGRVVTCPWHGGAFDVTNGEPVAAPCTVALRTYPSQVRDGALLAVLAAPQVIG